MQQQFDCRLAWADTEVLKDKTFSPYDKTVYSIICAHANPQTRECALKVKTIAEDTNCSIRSVQESLKALAQRGVVERRENFENGQQKASIYKIIGCLASCYRDTDAEMRRL
jgi:predicted transcriptional regulator